MATCRLIKGVHRTYKRTWVESISMRLPVIKPYGCGECKHEGETEAKNGGYVCLTCFHFMSYPMMKKDVQTGKSFIE